MPYAARSSGPASSLRPGTSHSSQHPLSPKSSRSPSPKLSRRHRRHYSSVADDEAKDVARRVSFYVALSPLSPRTSLLADALKETTETTDDTQAADTSYIMEPPPSARSSVISTVSTSSTVTAGSISTLGRFWSPSPSTPSQPSSPASSPTFTPASSSSSPTAQTSVSSGPASVVRFSTSASSAAPLAAATASSGHVVTYIPPLVDSTGGTVSRWQRATKPRHRRLRSAHRRPTAASFSAKQHAVPRQAASAYGLLLSDLRWLAHSAAELLALVWSRSTAPLLAVLAPRALARPLALPIDNVADAAESLVQIGLAIVELGVAAIAPALFLCLPGGLFLVWLVVCCACVRLASWPLNRGPASPHAPTVYRCPWNPEHADPDPDRNSDDGDDTGDERWFFVGGMGCTSRSLAKTGPRVAGAFGHSVTVIRPGHTYGAMADFLYALAQRLLLPFCILPSPGADTLYAELRHALVTSSSDALGTEDQRRVVVLAHNTGAIAMSQALARLVAEVPAARLAQLEIYTFGSLAPDFILPGTTSAQRGAAASTAFQTGSGLRPAVDSVDRAAPHVEHVAHRRDPCARFGVLRSVREDFAGRYCGGVFVFGSSGGGGPPSSVDQSRRGSPQPQSPPVKTQQYRRSFPVSLQHQNTKHHSQFIRRSVSLSRSFSSDRRHVGPSSFDQPPSPLSSLTAALLGRRSTLSMQGMLSMEDYLTALFGPEPWSMRPDLNGDGPQSSDAHFLDATVSVDRELAERRQVAAMAQSSSDRADSGYSGGGDGKSKIAHHRLSWTGLGATAKYGTTKGASVGAVRRLADTDGLLDLEAVRRHCKEFDGQRGRDTSLLAVYFAEAVDRHREQFGF